MATAGVTSRHYIGDGLLRPPGLTIVEDLLELLPGLQLALVVVGVILHPVRGCKRKARFPNKFDLFLMT